MQRGRITATALLIAAALSLAGASCAKKTGSTYVVLRFVTHAGTPADVGSIDLSLGLDGAMTSTTIRGPGGATFTLPADAALQIGAGSGPLDVTAVVRAADGTVIGHGSAQANVVRNDVARADVPIDFDGGNADAGSDAPTDAPEDGPDGGGGARLTMAPGNWDYGPWAIGASSGVETFTVRNAGGATTGAVSVNLDGAGPYVLEDDACTGKALSALDTCMVGVRFQPTAIGKAIAMLTVRATPGGSASAGLTGMGVAGGALSFAPGMHAFAGVDIGSSADYPFDLRNAAGAPTTSTIAVSIGGDGAPSFSLVNDACTGTTLAGGATCSVTVRFAPGTSGASPAMLVATASTGGTAMAGLSGRGLRPAALGAPMSLPFGLADVGRSIGPMTATIVNTGEGRTGVLAPAALSGAGAPAFAIATDGCAGVMLDAGGSCTVAVTFKPLSHGAFAASLDLSATPGGNASVALTGAGRDYLMLAVVKTGGGSGTVTSGEMPPLLACGTNCGAMVPRTAADPMVTLTAKPDLGSTFSGWAGCDAPSGPVCTMTMSSDKMVKATFDLKTFHLDVSRNEVGFAAGGVKSESGPTPAIDCGATCSGDYAAGTVITLDALPTSGAFGGWAGACSGLGSCTITLDADKAVKATFTPPNIVFVTSTSYTVTSVKSHGSGSTPAAKMLSGADALCNMVAGSASLPGSYVAWLSGDSMSAVGHLGVARGWARVDGLPFADSLRTPAQPGEIFYPPLLDQAGGAATGNDVVTGSTGDGTAFPGGTCMDWASTSASDSARSGERSAGSGEWSSAWSVACNASFHLYCLGVDRAVRVSPAAPAAGARKIFLSSSAFLPTGGLSAADSLCQLDASSASLSGSFKALLATTLASPASRFTTRGVPLVRLDGVVVMKKDTDFFVSVPNLLSSPNVLADGSYGGGGAWCGSGDLTTAQIDPAYDCVNWTSTSATAGGIGGDATTTSGGAFFKQGTPTCNSAGNRVYCIEE